MSGTYGELHFDQFGRVEMDHVYQVAQSLLLSCVREGEKGGGGATRFWEGRCQTGRQEMEKKIYSPPQSGAKEA